MTSTEKLDFIFSAIQRLTSPKGSADSYSLGFQNSPLPEIIYIGECAGHPWYKMTEAGDAGKQPVEHNFLAGMLSDLEVRQKKSNDYGDKLKLRIQMQCGDTSYSLVSGLSTYFSRALVSGLCSLGQDFNFETTPVGVEASTGDKGKVILPSLYVPAPPKGWVKVKCDAAKLTNDEDMAIAVNDVLRSRIHKVDAAA